MNTRHSFCPSAAVFGALSISLLLALPTLAQINAPPTSVTSPGFGGNPINGPRSSVTSVGPLGYAPPTRGWDGHVWDGRSWDGRSWDGKQHGGRDGHHGDGDRDGHRGDGDRDRWRHHHNNDTGSSWYAVPYAYYPDYPQTAVEGDKNEDDSADAEDDAEHQGGPTVLDRRGSGEHSYVPTVRNAPPAHAPERGEAETSAAEPEAPLAPTTLVFKDGHSVEVGNYAIQGTTLFDLTPGHKRKIAIADLDLEATRRQNDEHGVTFQLPRGTRVN